MRKPLHHLLSCLPSADTGTLVGVPDGVVWHISPVRTPRRIIYINVVIFGLVQRAKAETGCLVEGKRI